jgi:hypothetical protein
MSGIARTKKIGSQRQYCSLFVLESFNVFGDIRRSITVAGHMRPALVASLAPRQGALYPYPLL